MKAILRTWDNEISYEETVVNIDTDHDFAQGPYQDTVQFAVGSNQEILEIEDGSDDRLLLPGDVVILWAHPDPGSINHMARIDRLDGDYVYVSNSNQPFSGNYCGKKLPRCRVKLAAPRADAPALRDYRDVLLAAETAAALMAAMYESVTRQEDGSDSAVEELQEASAEFGNGFPSIWTWIATLAVHAPEDKFHTGEYDHVELTEVAAQELHNLLTNTAIPAKRREVLSPAECRGIWGSAMAVLDDASEARTRSAALARMQADIDELEALTRQGNYRVGTFTFGSEMDAIVYDNYGGPPLTISKTADDLWRTEGDRSTDAPRPATSFAIYRQPKGDA